VTDRPGPTPASQLSYAEAVEELEAILEGIEGDELDVDHLAERVGRAAELITECRGRIAATRFEVERIVSDLQAPTATAPGAAPEPTELGDGPA
jgi:exodeoxyribonuclease VII small subunit